MAPAHFTVTMTFIIGLIGLALNRKHLMSALLCLEAMSLSLFITFALWALQLETTAATAVPLFLLTFSACEASVWLALLVVTTRTHGTDHIQSLTLMRC